jgi:hypothetical protein
MQMLAWCSRRWPSNPFKVCHVSCRAQIGQYHCVTAIAIKLLTLAIALVVAPRRRSCIGTPAARLEVDHHWVGPLCRCRGRYPQQRLSPQRPQNDELEALRPRIAV